jgi:hypothetical protein
MSIRTRQAITMEGYKIPVDVLTCDPNHYVRCANMVAAVAALPSEVQELLERHDWSLRTAEGYRAFKVFDGRVIPTLCINGKKCFENRVPTLDELYAALLHAARTEDQRLVLVDSWSKANREYAPAVPSLPRAMAA